MREVDSGGRGWYRGGGGRSCWRFGGGIVVHNYYAALRQQHKMRLMSLPRRKGAVHRRRRASSGVVKAGPSHGERRSETPCGIVINSHRQHVRRWEQRYQLAPRAAKQALILIPSPFTLLD